MEKFCLKLNAFEANIREYFRKLREDQRLYDVTLATDDGQQIQAHKAILSVGSHFFSDIFLNCSHQNMLIYLKGINSAKLQQVLDFIYNEEVSVSQEEIELFMETGKELGVKGLEGELTDIGKSIEEDKQNEDKNNVFDHEGLKKEENGLDTQGNSVIQSGEGQNEINEQELDNRLEQMTEKKEGVWACKVCRKMMVDRRDLKRHAETHIEGMSHVCHICSKIYTTRSSLRVHINGIHSELLSCDICGKSGMNRQKYTFHNRKLHKSLKH